jgi:flagellar biosynthetic protein FliR
MFSFTSSELATLIAGFFYPATRVLAMVAIAPFFNNTATPVRARLVLGLAVTVGVMPTVPPLPAIDPASGLGLLLLAREMVIGLAMGFAMRIAFAAVNMAGEQMGFQMGLGFALFYDPQNTAQTPVLPAFLVLLTTLVFISINGHLMMIAVLAQSFSAIPIAFVALPSSAWGNLVSSAAVIFSTGLLMALPVSITLLITNLAMGVLNRAAPQINLFAIGFPITIIGGFIVLAFTLSYLSVPLQRLFEDALQMMLAFPLRAAP